MNKIDIAQFADLLKMEKEVIGSLNPVAEYPQQWIDTSDDMASLTVTSSISVSSVNF